MGQGHIQQLKGLLTSNVSIVASVDAFGLVRSQVDFWY